MVIISQLTICPDSFSRFDENEEWSGSFKLTKNLAQNPNKHAWCFSHINCKDEFWLKTLSLILQYKPSSHIITDNPEYAYYY